MTFKEYLQKLDTANELKSIDTRINPELELAALCRREFAAESGGSALRFNHIQGSHFSVVANLFGSEKRVAALLHLSSLDQLSEKITRWLNKKKGERFLNTDRVKEPEVKSSLLTETTRLSELPAIKSWPDEGGRYLTLALTLTQHPETGERNLGLYRAQILDDDHIALNFSPQSGAGYHYEAAKRLGKSLPLCLLVGVDPALIWVAAAPFPAACDEFEFYQSVFEEKIDWCHADTQAIKIPINTDLVIEGQIDTDGITVEGPYGNHTGFYVTRNDCPLVKVTAVHHQPDPVIPLTVVGPPPSENIYLGMANEILIRAVIKINFPHVCDVWMPHETIFHGAAVIAVRRRTKSENRELIDNLWQDSPLNRSRLILLVDEKVHVRSLSNSWWRLVNGLKTPRIYTDGNRTAIDATEIDPGILVQESAETASLLQQHRDEYRQW